MNGIHGTEDIQILTLVFHGIIKPKFFCVCVYIGTARTQEGTLGLGLDIHP